MRVALAMFLIATGFLTLAVLGKINHNESSCSHDPYIEGSKCNALCEDIYHNPMESYDAYNRKCICNTTK